MKTNKRILAIDPGTHYMGVAVLDGTKLTYYGVKTLPRRNSPREMLKEGRNVVRSLINDFKPRVFVVEKTYFANSRNGTLLNVFANEIAKISRQKKVRVKVMAANTVRKIVCNDGEATKQDVAKVITNLHPELSPFLSSDRRWKERFYYNMFDAVALGTAALIKTNKVH